jgi:hypothetical protein
MVPKSRESRRVRSHRTAPSLLGVPAPRLLHSARSARLPRLDPTRRVNLASPVNQRHLPAPKVRMVPATLPRQPARKALSRRGRQPHSTTLEPGPSGNAPASPG